jgi:hypothetical protein
VVGEKPPLGSTEMETERDRDTEYGRETKTERETEDKKGRQRSREGTKESWG